MLDAMRLTGDAPADAVIKDIFASGEPGQTLATLTQLTNNDAPAPSSMRFPIPLS